MLKVFVSASIVLALLFAMAGYSYSAESEVDAILNLLEKKGLVTKDEVYQFRAEIATKKQEVPAQIKPITVPDWTQNVKWSGDVRFRTRGDWGKTAQNQPQTSSPLNADDLRKQRLQESVRGRFAIEGRVNESTYAGARFAGGNTNPRSDDDTLTGYFNKHFVMFDQYYMRFEPDRGMIMRYGRYFSDIKLWAGKFGNPFECSEITWDTDVSPGGVALQYVSNDIATGYLPACRIYSNIGMLWLDESAAFNTDPILWAFQAGAKTESFGPLDSTLNIATTIYNFANLKGKTPNANSARTNSRTWIGDYGYGIGASSLGSYKYEYNVFDLLIRIDNETFGDYKFSHGFVIDFIYNASVHQENTNKGALIGAYIGKKKLKDVGDWKIGTEWRFIERDAIPDFTPDRNFYGFGTHTNANTNPNVNGIPAAGGTNGKGVKSTFECQMMKNTSCVMSFFWMEPIKSWDKRDPWSEVLIDVITKF